VYCVIHTRYLKAHKVVGVGVGGQQASCLAHHKKTLKFAICTFKT